MQLRDTSLMARAEGMREIEERRLPTPHQRFEIPRKGYEPGDWYANCQSAWNTRIGRGPCR